MADAGGVVSRAAADRIIESLRTGVPPVGHLRRFTVGRGSEIERLEETLRRPEEHRGDALLLQANYGAGKTHLLRLIRELALDAGFAVALVTVDSKSGVRFNRMDQVTAAVMRSFELDELSGKGAWKLFDAFAGIDPQGLEDDGRKQYERITAGGRWDFAEELSSPALFVALRAWLHTPSDTVRELIVDWLSYPWEYRAYRKKLYDQLVHRLLPRVRDPRPEATFYADDVFLVHVQGHVQAWAALGDLDLLVRVCGRRGLVLLFDEFEDVIQNLNNTTFEQNAFHNLFRLFSGERFAGMSYFAVTPDFAEKCRTRLYERFAYHFPVERFDHLARFEMAPIRRQDFLNLAKEIRRTHGQAYDWDAEGEFDNEQLKSEVVRLFSRSSADQIRQAVEGFVVALDRQLD
ncbi:BREX system ATP-binding domain-containing protein [Kribbella sp. NPDC023972]|uniref:BREX system ATP-binding domain-containing protein n=1 Tax=Kribbella sp. NPDC023972 TaxID=3154795 RepID=UPI0033E86367